MTVDAITKPSGVCLTGCHIRSGAQLCVRPNIPTLQPMIQILPPQWQCEQRFQPVAAVPMRRESALFAIVDWEVTDRSANGYMHFRQKDRALDREWVRTVCRSLLFADD